MRKKIIAMLSIFCALICMACSNCKNDKAIELMGAGDRIHDTYTFANIGTKIEETEPNVYLVSGSVEKIENENVKEEFKIDDDVDYVVAIKLTACGSKVDKDKVKINIDGSRAYDAEHINGSDYTFIILEAVAGSATSISVAWDGVSQQNYVVRFSEDLVLK